MTRRKLGMGLMWFSLVVAIGAALYTFFGYTIGQSGPGGAFVYPFPSIMAATAAGFVPFCLGLYLWANAPDRK